MAATQRNFRADMRITKFRFSSSVTFAVAVIGAQSTYYALPREGVTRGDIDDLVTINSVKWSVSGRVLLPASLPGHFFAHD